MAQLKPTQLKKEGEILAEEMTKIFAEDITKINMKYPPPIVSDDKLQFQSESDGNSGSGILPLLGLAGIIGLFILKNKQPPIVQPAIQPSFQQTILAAEEEIRKFEMMQAGLKERQKMMEEEKKKQTVQQTEINTAPTLIPLKDRLKSSDARRIKFGFEEESTGHTFGML